MANEELTAREIAAMVTAGFTTTEIADRIGVTISAVYGRKRRLTRGRTRHV